MTPCLLVFPMDMDESLSFITHARALGFRIIGSSSALAAPLKKHDIDAFFPLPYVTDPGFTPALIQLITQQRITHVYTPHSGVWLFIETLQQNAPSSSLPAFRLCGKYAFIAEWEAFEPSYDWACRMCTDNFAEQLAIRAQHLPAAPLSNAQYAGLHQNFSCIPGQCTEDKLALFCAVMRYAPQGDVIEIGSLYGRSAMALAKLAAWYGIGSAISIDPWRWNDHETDNQGEQARVLEKSNSITNPEHMYQQFLATAAFTPGMSCIRKTSSLGIADYLSAAKQKHLTHEVLPTVPISSKIAVLHIDGNHRYDMVKLDIDLWTPHLQPGGWLILDDYFWKYGDGPKCAGDALLSDYEYAFVSAESLVLHKPA